MLVGIRAQPAQHFVRCDELFLLYVNSFVSDQCYQLCNGKVNRRAQNYHPLSTIPLGLPFRHAPFTFAIVEGASICTDCIILSPLRLRVLIYPTSFFKEMS
jgi:hypothetical protein